MRQVRTIAEKNRTLGLYPFSMTFGYIEKLVDQFGFSAANLRNQILRPHPGGVETSGGFFELEALGEKDFLEEGWKGGLTIRMRRNP